jgi:hypothetical protein
MYVHSRFLLSLILAFGVLNPWAPPAMSSPIPAVSFSSNIHSTLTGDNHTFGWQFSLSKPVQVTSLGVYDLFAGDGLAASHSIGLWTDTGTLLTSATVAPSDPVEPDFFRYTAIPPLTLTPGTYVIGAFYETASDATINQAPDFTTAPGITFQDNRVVPQ